MGEGKVREKRKRREGVQKRGKKETERRRKGKGCPKGKRGKKREGENKERAQKKRGNKEERDDGNLKKGKKRGASIHFHVNKASVTNQKRTRPSYQIYNNRNV